MRRLHDPGPLRAQMQKSGCFGAAEEPCNINCKLHASFAASAIVLTLTDYVIALVLVLIFPRLLAARGTLTVMRCASLRAAKPLR